VTTAEKSSVTVEFGATSGKSKMFNGVKPEGNDPAPSVRGSRKSADILVML
jgi:hypothetical protein